MSNGFISAPPLRYRVKLARSASVGIALQTPYPHACAWGWWDSAVAIRVVSVTPYLLMKGLLIGWLLASILLAHGCHGNEDQELFGAWTASVGK